jgi:hypothetical protein
MKKILYTLIILAGLLSVNACSEEALNLEPTDRISGSVLFADVTSAEAAINGIYRMLYIAGWGSDWATENNGQTAIQLFADLMGEDHLMKEQGSGWFYEDYRLNVHSDYSHKAGRSYQVWNFYYTIISNANYIIAADGEMAGDPKLAASIVGQAYAVRAFAYHNLVQLYQQTYWGNQTAPGVPVYTEPTAAGTPGKPRGTVQDVYDRINEDLEKAIELLAGKTQKHISHIDYYVANGLKARARLTQHDYPAAAAAATEALKKTGLTLASVEDLGGNNDVNTVDVMWGVNIITDQGQGYVGFFAHMDADGEGLYASRARQCISTGLYNLIPTADSRKNAWFQGNIGDGTGSNTSYCQIKFRMKDYANRTGDYLFMRAEEMILIKAEAECHQKLFQQARTTITILGNARTTNYVAILASRADSEVYNTNTNAPLQTLMDEILFQRRVELWGEAGRIFDLQRLGLGYNRVYTGSNHTETVATKNTNAASPLFILPLPQSEFDGNENIGPDDQNQIVI